MMLTSSLVILCFQHHPLLNIMDIDKVRTLHWHQLILLLCKYKTKKEGNVED